MLKIRLPSFSKSTRIMISPLKEIRGRIKKDAEREREEKNSGTNDYMIVDNGVATIIRPKGEL